MLVADYRNLTENLNRKANVDWHSCVSASELDYWKTIAEKVLVSAKAVVCKRAKPEDIAQFESAIKSIEWRFEQFPERIEKLRRKSEGKALSLVH